MMKKILSIIILLLIIVCGVLLYRNNYINEANEHLNIKGLKLLMRENEVGELLNKEFANVGGFGGVLYISKIDDSRIIFSGFPDVLNDYKLTSIRTTNPNHNFYEISVSDNAEKAVNILKKNGFKKTDNYGREREIRFRKRKLYVFFYFDNDTKITQIGLGLESTNKNKVQF